MQVTLTARDRDLLVCLSTKFRVLTESQAARGWWTPAGEGAARARLRRLVAGGWLSARHTAAHPELELDRPVFRWKPGERSPNADRVSYRLKKRWTAQERLTTIYLASHKAAAEFGGIGGALTHPLHLTHDLHVTTVFLKFRSAAPARAGSWVSEYLIAEQRSGQVLPDAALVDARGSIVKAIEFGGAYDPRRVRHFHEDCEVRELEYELW